LVSLRVNSAGEFLVMTEGVVCFKADTLQLAECSSFANCEFYSI